MDPALLLYAHGTRDPRGAEEMTVLLEHLRARLPGRPVAHAWIEDFAQPNAVESAHQLVAQGAERLVVVPFLVLAAGHAKYDVPKDVQRICDALPDLPVAKADVLGLQPRLLDLARERVHAVCTPEQRDGAALVVTGVGSSDPEANGDLAKGARHVAELAGLRWAEIGFAGVTWPTAEEAFRRVARAGAARIVHFSWSLLAGLLERRVAAWAAAVAAETGVAIIDAGRFGPDPAVADAVVARYEEARGVCERRLDRGGA